MGLYIYIYIFFFFLFFFGGVVYYATVDIIKKEPQSGIGNYLGPPYTGRISERYTSIIESETEDFSTSFLHGFRV